MGLIDSHAHLTYAGLIERVEEVLQNSREAGVERVITIGTTLEDAREALRLAGVYRCLVHAAVGIHPHHADGHGEEALAALAVLWQNPEVVAFGEMGLDYHYDFADRATQRRVFERQLILAEAHDRPLIIHCREAFADVVPMLLDHGYAHRRVVFHCFTGTEPEAELVAAEGWRISFTGIVTFRKSGWLQDIARTYPADRLMVETDAPYLSPEPVRSKSPNEPAFVAHTARFLARLREVKYEDLVKQTAQNTRQFFGLDRVGAG